MIKMQKKPALPALHTMHGTNGRVFCFHADAGNLFARMFVRPSQGRFSGPRPRRVSNLCAGAAVPRGVKDLSFHYEKDGDSRRKSDDLPDNAAPEPKAKKKPAAPGVGDALRTVYQQTVNEDIPPEMLDLLGKLG